MHFNMFPTCFELFSIAVEKNHPKRVFREPMTTPKVDDSVLALMELNSNGN